MNEQPEQFIPESLQAPEPAPAPARESRPMRIDSPFTFSWRSSLVILVAATVAIVVWLWPREAGSGYKGQGWEYVIEDVELTAPLSVEMDIYKRDAFQKKLRNLGDDGWELSNVMTSPRKAYEKGFCYRLVFKRPGKTTSAEVREHLDQINRPRDLERFEAAAKAESKAESEKFQRQLDDIKNGR